MELGRSLMYVINNRGPRMLPCGTPEATGTRSDNVLSITTHCCLLKRYARKKANAEPEMPRFYNLVSNWSCGTESNAFLISKYTTSMWFLLEIASKIELENLSNCWTVDLFFMKPN